MVQIDINQILSQLTAIEIVLLVLFVLGFLVFFIGILTWLYIAFYEIGFSLYLRKNKVILNKRKFLLEPYITLKTFNPVIWSKFNPLENTKKKLQYIYNNQDTEDPNILHYKRKLRPAFKFLLYTLIAFIVLFIILFLIALFSEKVF